MKILRYFKYFVILNIDAWPNYFEGDKIAKIKRANVYLRL
jgi:hypothetical protein